MNQFEDARDLARAKGAHGHLRAFGERRAKSTCPGQLRTAYVRLSVPRPTWSPVGIVCDACRAFWPDQGAQAAP